MREAIEPEDSKLPVEEEKDQMALAAIYQAVPEDMLLQVRHGKL